MLLLLARKLVEEEEQRNTQGGRETAGHRWSAGSQPAETRPSPSIGPASFLADNVNVPHVLYYIMSYCMILYYSAFSINCPSYTLMSNITMTTWVNIFAGHKSLYFHGVLSTAVPRCVSADINLCTVYSGSAATDAILQKLVLYIFFQRALSLSSLAGVSAAPNNLFVSVKNIYWATRVYCIFLCSYSYLEDCLVTF